MWARTTSEIGKIIRAARVRRRLSQADLARLLGTTQAWISEVEKGKDTAQIGLVLRALSHLDVRLRADESQRNADEASRSQGKRVDLDRIIKNLSRPVRTSGARK